MKRIVSFFIILFLSFSFVVPVKALEDDKITLYLFYGDGCPHCASEKLFLEEIKDEYEWLSQFKHSYFVSPFSEIFIIIEVLYSYDKLKEFVDEAHGYGLKTALAGSVKKEQLKPLHDIGCDVVGIRGAACVGGDRNTGKIHHTAVAELKELCDSF